MEIRLHTFTFEPHKGGLHEQRHRFAFSRPVAKAGTVLRGYSAQFVDGDHHFGQLTVSLRSEIVNDAPDGPEVVVYAVLGLRDFSGSWDDRFSGTIDMCLFFEMGLDIHLPFEDTPEIEPPLEA
jgi:hypothetical protein